MDFRVIILVTEPKGGQTAHISTYKAQSKGDAAVSALMESTLKGVDINRAKVHVMAVDSAR